MIKYYTFSFILALVSSISFGQATITATGGNWNLASSWNAADGNGGIPGNNDIIVIPVGVTITVKGTDHVLDNATLIIQGTLIMESLFDWWPAYGSLTFTGSSGVIMEPGSSLLDETVAGGDDLFISVEGTTVWSGSTCTTNCGLLSGDQNPTSETKYPVNINNPLPIELISFNTSLSGEVVEILWATAAEIDNDYFTLERSEDGVSWDIIGEEAGAGNSTIRLDYSFVDHNPIPGISYYRLKQTDYDGQYEYFDPAVVLYEPNDLFKVFPNPTTNVLQLTTSSDLSNATISIKNLSGQNKAVRVDAASHQAIIDMSDLPIGVYLLEIVFPESVLTKRIVKN